MPKKLNLLWIILIFLSACAPAQASAPAEAPTVVVGPLEPATPTVGAESATTNIIVEGNLCDDANGNALCDPGEGVAGLQLEAYYVKNGALSEHSVLVTTREDGYYYIEMLGEFEASKFEGLAINVDVIPEACQQTTVVSAVREGISTLHFVISIAFTKQCVDSYEI